MQKTSALHGENIVARQRLLPDWISAFETYTENSESPRAFHVWAACSAVAAALQRRCYITWGHNTIYPNMYVIIVGPSGRARKSEPINISRKFVEKLNIPIIGEDNSQEAIIREMKNSVQSFTDRRTRRIQFHSSVSCFLEELSVFTGQQNTQFLAYLTNWYDSRDKWKRSTKHQGVDEIIGMCFNMLAATAPDWLPYILPREAIGGGFTSRCIFVVEDRKSRIIANPNLYKPDQRLASNLGIDLELINTMSGSFELDEDAISQYTEWYEQEEKKNEAGKPTMADELFNGYTARRPMHLMKLSMVMSASRGDDYVITAKDFRRAKTLLEITEKKMPKVFAGIGKAKYAEETELALSYIARHGSVSKSDLLRQFFRSMDNYSLDIVIRVLSDMRLVRVIIEKGETIYQYIGNPDPDGPPTPLKLIKGGKA